jgi:signal transduction histidine kinase
MSSRRATSRCCRTRPAAVVLRAGIRSVGAARESFELLALVRQLQEGHGAPASLAEVSRDSHHELESGGERVLALEIDALAGEYLFWFRPAGSGWEPRDMELAARARLAVLGKTRRHALDSVEPLLEQLRIGSESCVAISHELRNSVNSVAGWASLLRSETLPAERRARGVDVIGKNVRILQKLVDDLLETRRLGCENVALEQRSLDFGELVEDALQAILPDITEKALRLETELERPLGTLQGDAVRIRQVLSNVLANAVKFTPARGVVRVVARRTAGHVEVCVTDSGIGISPDFLPHAFEAFRQAAPGQSRERGFGLGLSIAKQLVELHGGRIVAESPGPGRGATFRIFLPAS